MAEDYPRPIVTVDIAALTLADERLAVLLQPRATPPDAGVPALVGGFVRVDEDVSVDAAAARVLRSKTGISHGHMEQLGCFSGPDRDPRGWSLSVAFVAVFEPTALQQAVGANGQTDRATRLVPVDALPDLPFDHAEIVRAAAERLRGKSSYSSLPLRLLGPRFTLPAVHAAYQALLGTRLDPASFRRKILELGVLRPVPGPEGRTRGGANTGRPAQLYEAADPERLQLFKKSLDG